MKDRGIPTKENLDLPALAVGRGQKQQQQQEQQQTVKNHERRNLPKINLGRRHVNISLSSTEPNKNHTASTRASNLPYPLLIPTAVSTAQNQPVPNEKGSNSYTVKPVKIVRVNMKPFSHKALPLARNNPNYSDPKISKKKGKPPKGVRTRRSWGRNNAADLRVPKKIISKKAHRAGLVTHSKPVKASRRNCRDKAKGGEPHPVGSKEQIHQLPAIHAVGVDRVKSPILGSNAVPPVSARASELLTSFPVWNQDGGFIPQDRDSIPQDRGFVLQKPENKRHIQDSNLGLLKREQFSQNKKLIKVKQDDSLQDRVPKDGCDSNRQDQQNNQEQENDSHNHPWSIPQDGGYNPQKQDFASPVGGSPSEKCSTKKFLGLKMYPPYSKLKPIISETPSNNSVVFSYAQSSSSLVGEAPPQGRQLTREAEMKKPEESTKPNVNEGSKERRSGSLRKASDESAVKSNRSASSTPNTAVPEGKTQYKKQDDVQSLGTKPGVIKPGIPRLKHPEGVKEVSFPQWRNSNNCSKPGSSLGNDGKRFSSLDNSPKSSVYIGIPPDTPDYKPLSRRSAFRAVPERQDSLKVRKLSSVRSSEPILKESRSLLASSEHDCQDLQSFKLLQGPSRELNTLMQSQAKTSNPHLPALSSNTGLLTPRPSRIGNDSLDDPINTDFTPDTPIRHGPKPNDILRGWLKALEDHCCPSYRPPGREGHYSACNSQENLDYIRWVHPITPRQKLRSAETAVVFLTRSRSMSRKRESTESGREKLT